MNKYIKTYCKVRKKNAQSKFELASSILHSYLCVFRPIDLINRLVFHEFRLDSYFNTFPYSFVYLLCLTHSLLHSPCWSLTLFPNNLSFTYLSIHLYRIFSYFHLLNILNTWFLYEWPRLPISFLFVHLIEPQVIKEQFLYSCSITKIQRSDFSFISTCFLSFSLSCFLRFILSRFLFRLPFFSLIFFILSFFFLVPRPIFCSLVRE